MTTLYLSPVSLVVQYLTNVGIVAAGAQIYTYVGGTANTPLATYTDSTGLVANPNPMTANAAGRPAGTSGNAVAFWVPAGDLLKLVVTDASGNQLVYLDNISALNDPQAPNSPLVELANPVTGSGADLVANAMRSYDIFTTLRAANVPALATGETLVVSVEGGAAVGDVLAGEFYWSASSTATDDGVNVIKPTAAGTGRYLRLVNESIYATRTVSTSVTSQTALYHDPLLLTPVLPLGFYAFELYLAFFGPSAGGFQFAQVGSAVTQATLIGAPIATGWVNAAAYGPVNSAFNSTTPDAIATIGTGINEVLVKGMLWITTAGTIQVGWAQDSSTASATLVYRGSYLSLQKIG